MRIQCFAAKNIGTLQQNMDEWFDKQEVEKGPVRIVDSSELTSDSIYCVMITWEFQREAGERRNNNPCPLMEIANKVAGEC